MAYHLDTSAFSDLMREHPLMLTRISALPPDEMLGICTVVRGEILHGLGRLPDGQRRRELTLKATRLFAALPCSPIVSPVADHYAEIKLTRQSKGLALDENDLWIAATARCSGAVLITRDSDFQHIGGLKVEDWTR